MINRRKVDREYRRRRNKKLRELKLCLYCTKPAKGTLCDECLDFKRRKAQAKRATIKITTNMFDN